jgi:hypothetical protein
MRSFFLTSGRVLALCASLIYIIAVVRSVFALFGNRVDDEMVMRPFYYTYVVIINGALFFVFGTVIEMERR